MASKATDEQRPVGITCPTCQRDFPSYPDFTAHIGNPTCANEAVQAAGEQHDNGNEPWCYYYNLYRVHLADRSCCGDTQPRGLARCDATTLVELAEILADVLDDGADNDGTYAHRPWKFYPTNRNWREETPETNRDRLNFIAEVQRRIITRTTPAVRGGKR